MMRRTPEQIINDLLNVINKEEHLTLKQIAQYANISFDQSRRYFRAISKNNLALLTGLTPIDTAKIMQKGLHYLATFRELESLIRSGLP